MQNFFISYEKDISYTYKIVTSYCFFNFSIQMKMLNIPALNGLGKTKGVESTGEILFSGIPHEKLELDNQDLNAQEGKIYSKILKELKRDKLLLVGGDHSLSYSSGKAFIDYYKENFCFVIFDAHYDLMPPMDNPTHEEWLRGLIDYGLKGENVLLVGIRRKSKEIDKREIKFAKKHNIKIMFADEFNKKNILDFIKNKKTYISFDIDVLDSSIIQATAYPEKNGLNLESIKLVNKIMGLKNFKCLDIVEINFQKADEKEKIKKILKGVLNEKS
jgi:arginase family enzyme